MFVCKWLFHTVFADNLFFFQLGFASNTIANDGSDDESALRDGIEVNGLIL